MDPTTAMIGRLERRAAAVVQIRLGQRPRARAQTAEATQVRLQVRVASLAMSMGSSSARAQRVGAMLQAHRRARFIPALI